MDGKKEKPSILPWGMTKDGLQPNSVQVYYIQSYNINTSVMQGMWWGEPERVRGIAIQGEHADVVHVPVDVARAMRISK